VVKTHPSQGNVRPVIGAEASLLTTQDGAFVSVATRELVPGNAYTLLLVVINTPQACETRPCEGSEVLTNADHIKADLVHADGLIADRTGTGHFAAYLPRGDLGGWFGHGYRVAQDAEFHLVVSDHGPLIPNLAATMIGSFRGGCKDESVPPPFPSAARADGVAGPNACRVVQKAVFSQTAPH
jgi:hypothetical protein